MCSAWVALFDFYETVANEPNASEPGNYPANIRLAMRAILGMFSACWRRLASACWRRLASGSRLLASGTRLQRPRGFARRSCRAAWP
eukprot:4294651-Heterocapsa_arctica.AAC.1